MQLCERYRPQKLEDLVGQAKIVKRINLLRERGGLVGRVFWMVGRSGCGKTSAARIIAKEIADPFATYELDSQEWTMDFLRDIERMCQGKPIGGKAWAFICNEAHRLSDRVVSRLQTLVEDRMVQKNATLLFTTTFHGQASLFDNKIDACPFLSRAVICEFEARNDQLMLDYACHIRKIAQAEKCDGKPIGDYLDLVRKHDGNLRSCLGAIEAGCMLD